MLKAKIKYRKFSTDKPNELKASQTQLREQGQK